jgi:hypothetical protein
MAIDREIVYLQVMLLGVASYGTVPAKLADLLQNA